jgi:anti-sigma factor RsiW
VRCSSCEPLLDRYIEGTLSERQMRTFTQHLRLCESCKALLAELRVVDALLATSPVVELPPNFTFAVMAEVRTTPMATSRRVSIWALLTFYVISAWIAVTAGSFAFGSSLRGLPSLAASVGSSISHGVAALAGVAHVFGPATPVVIAIGVTILLLDVALVAATLFFYRSVRPRLAAHLANSEAS